MARTLTTSTLDRSVVGVIVDVQHAGNSHNGNGRWLARFTDGRAFLTATDSAVADVIQRFRAGDRVVFTLSARGTIVRAIVSGALGTVETMVGRTANGDRVYVTMRLGMNRRAAETTDKHQRIDAGTAETLSVSGYVVGKGARHAHSLGQCRSALRDVVTFAPGWTSADVRELSALWNAWHLNDMTAGCSHVIPVWEEGPYGRRRPSLTATPECPVSGYRYGHAWLFHVMPAEVVSAVSRLMGLPTTDVPRDY